MAACVFEGPSEPTLASVDLVAHLALGARRIGGRPALSDVAPAMRRLLDLSGLLVEMGGKAEGGEKSLGVHGGEEKVHACDPPV